MRVVDKRVAILSLAGAALIAPGCGTCDGRGCQPGGVRPLSSPRLETTNGTTKFSAHFSQVAAVASPEEITSAWLIAVRMRPTTSAIRTVRRRWSRRAQ